MKSHLKVLAIDTSRGNIDIVAVAVNQPDRRKDFVKYFEAGASRPLRIEDHIATAVKKNMKELELFPDLVVINLGPGSYTSLRSGIVFVKGWFQGLKAKTGKAPFKIVGVKNKEFPELPTKESYVNNIVKKGIKSYTEGRTDNLKNMVPVYGTKNI